MTDRPKRRDPAAGPDRSNPSTDWPLEPAVVESVNGLNTGVLDVAPGDAKATPPDAPTADSWRAEWSEAPQPDSDRSVPFEIIGDDDRIRIEDTAKYPYRCICWLIITAADNSLWSGTGWLAGPRTVVTAGHCVFMHNRGGRVKQIEIVPGSNGATRPFDSCFSTDFKAAAGWINGAIDADDYGAVILPPQHRYGDRLGFFGFVNLSESVLEGSIVNLAGYPENREPPGSLYWHARNLERLTPQIIYYRIDTFRGQSGSPVWLERNGKQSAVGIHSNGTPTQNWGTRISASVFKDLKAWKV